MLDSFQSYLEFYVVVGVLEGTVQSIRGLIVQITLACTITHVNGSAMLA